MDRMRRFDAAVGVAALACLAPGCGSAASGRTSDGKVRVVAAENFWGDIASQIGGSHVDVTSLISGPDADPHLFDPGTSAGLSVATAGVVLVNGAGYDPFMNRLLNAAPSSARRVVTVADVLHVSGGDTNPHLWYDLPRLRPVVLAIAHALEVADPADAAAYRAGAARTLHDVVTPLQGAVRHLRQTAGGAPVAYTERVPGYLLAAAGLRVLTPPSFARSIENGTDPGATDDLAMRQLITEHQIKALVFNRQATSPVTAQLQSLARDNHISVVPVTETMPPGESFQSWQLHQIRALRAALAQ
jgi:zinc/manganese transport system substrate-binding protein